MLGNTDIDKLIDRICERLERGKADHMFIAIHHFKDGAVAYPYRMRPTMGQVKNDIEEYDSEDENDHIEITGPCYFHWSEN